ncbi:MAG: UDP-N-acetylmuramoyl-L-alanyl-D-glutamate--2,6-diaminopimelate ligase [Burkholderiales bacterium]
MNVLQQLERLGTRITRLTADSRKVSPGIAFAAYPGERADGRAYIPQAIERGSDAILWERDNFCWNGDWQVANLGITQLRDHVGEIADALYGHPSEHLWMLGVTGTNGKTSVSRWLAQCLNANERKTALLGTLGNGFLEALEPAINTTPDAIELQEYLATYREEGADAVAMEVSSHGLAQGRVNGVQFDVALFTNLSRDHLDYHGDMASYGEAKAGLFAMPGLKNAVINLDDIFGMALVGKLRDSAVQTIGYAIDQRADFGFPTLRAKHLDCSAQGLAFEVSSPWGNGAVTAPVFGRFNAYNVLAVLGGLIASDIGFASAVESIAGIQPVPGRMQRLGGGDLPLVLVDYAHTPDALENSLGAARELVAGNGRLVCVFGCGGNRDPGKRPMMGGIAERLCDQVILTSDNPRDEDPLSILNDIRSGMIRGCQIVPDRNAAIAQSISQSGESDVILIAGKGHENYQEIRSLRLPFSDVEVAKRALGVKP